MMHRVRALSICVLAAAPPGLALAHDATPPIVRLLAAREQLLAFFDTVPQERLQTAFLRCDRESREYPLPLEHAVSCAMTWDALLRRGFDGDLERMLAWWRVRREP